MTTCCVAGYRRLPGVAPDKATWPPVLAPAGPWEICDCAEGDVVRRAREEEKP